MAKDAYIHIRINGELKAAAQDYAKNTGRSLAGLIDWLLRKELKENGIAERQEGREIMKALKEKIEKAIEKEAMKKGIMGTENCTVTLTLTDAEKEEFRNLDLDEKHYWWEIDENELTVTYTEEPGMKVYDSAEVGGQKFAILVDNEMNAYEAVEINGEWETDFSYPSTGVDSFDVAGALNFEGAKKAGYKFVD
jgi:antitoxin component of RelBE/YafQ-DinJ toxin-antitoxin module